MSKDQQVNEIASRVVKITVASIWNEISKQDLNGTADYSKLFMSVAEKIKSVFDEMTNKREE